MDEIERALAAEENTPARVAVEAHMKATWADITHVEGRWLTWAEAARRYETLMSGGWRPPAEVHAQMESAKAAPRPTSLLERIAVPAVEPEGEPRWTGVAMGRHKITADEARIATRGDLAEEGAQGALGKLWAVFREDSTNAATSGGRCPRRAYMRGCDGR